MVYCRLLLVSACLMGWSHQTNVIPFRPIDSGIGSVVDEYLKPHYSQNSFSDILDNFRVVISENVNKNKKEVLSYLRSIIEQFDNYNVSKGIQLKRIDSVNRNYSIDSDDFLVQDLVNFAENHVIKVQVFDLVNDVTRQMRRSMRTLQPSGRCEFFFVFVFC